MKLFTYCRKSNHHDKKQIRNNITMYIEIIFIYIPLEESSIVIHHMSNINRYYSVYYIFKILLTSSRAFLMS